MPPTELNAIVHQRIDLTPDLFILRVSPLNNPVQDFKAGQFAILGLPGSAPRCLNSQAEETPAPPDKMIQRAYSIASPPHQKDFLEFYVTLVRHGVLTPRLFNLRRRDRLYLGPKMSGHFTIQNSPQDKNIVFIATGTGVAPFVSMIESELKVGGRKMALLHGVRESMDLGYRTQLEALSRICPNFTYLPTLSRMEPELIPWRGRTGYVNEIWQSDAIEKAWGFKPEASNTHVYLCGNPLMIESLVKTLEGQGFKEHKKAEPGEIHVERYW